VVLTSCCERYAERLVRRSNACGLCRGVGLCSSSFCRSQSSKAAAGTSVTRPHLIEGHSPAATFRQPSRTLRPTSALASGTLYARRALVMLKPPPASSRLDRKTVNHDLLSPATTTLSQRYLPGSYLRRNLSVGRTVGDLVGRFYAALFAHPTEAGRIELGQVSLWCWYLRSLSSPPRQRERCSNGRAVLEPPHDSSRHLCRSLTITP
jgi:hypothetical protein